MSKPLAWGTATALAAVLWLGGLVALCRAAPDASEQKIEAALGEPEQLEFIETPLAEVVDYLKARHKINIVVDKKALETVGVGTDTPITANIKDVSFESALWLLLRPLGLTWTIDHEVLLITTPEEADQLLATRVYPLEGVQVCADAPATTPLAGASVSTVPAPPPMDPTVALIQQTIAPAAWDAAGGPGSMAVVRVEQERVLVVSQTYAVHRRIARLLADLRACVKSGPADRPK